MEEETKKKGKGRPRKGEESPKAKTKTTKRKKSSWGGKREGAGRKKGVKIGQIKENPINSLANITCTENTLRRVRALRELTKQDDMPFNRMFESWVTDLAKEYGIE